jgi:ATP-dependent Lon protease
MNELSYFIKEQLHEIRKKLRKAEDNKNKTDMEYYRGKISGYEDILNKIRRNNLIKDFIKTEKGR